MPRSPDIRNVDELDIPQYNGAFGMDEQWKASGKDGRLGIASTISYKYLRGYRILAAGGHVD